jgi:hypothetical protein
MTEAAQRERLPQRRGGETFEFKAGPPGKEITYTATLGYFPDGRLGELFLRAGKSGTDLAIATLEIAIAVSFALQHGCSVETMRAAFPRTADGRPEGVMGTLLDILAFALNPKRKEPDHA